MAIVRFIGGLLFIVVWGILIAIGFKIGNHVAEEIQGKYIANKVKRQMKQEGISPEGEVL